MNEETVPHSAGGQTEGAGKERDWAVAEMKHLAVSAQSLLALRRILNEYP